jgi:hypothetical protein
MMNFIIFSVLNIRTIKAWTTWVDHVACIREPRDSLKFVRIKVRGATVVNA